MAFTPEEQRAFLSGIGLEVEGLEQGVHEAPEEDPTGKGESTLESLEFDWSLIEGLSLTAKDDYHAAYRILFDAYKRHRREAPGWNKELHNRLVEALNERRSESKTGYVKEKVKARKGERAANIAADVANILKSAGVEIDDDLLNAAIQEHTT